MRILITNNTLDNRAGSELYVCDLAVEMLRRGHSPVAYSPLLGEVAKELRRCTVPVVDDVASCPWRPDVIHGQHHLETMTALLAFPGVPAVSVCHGWLSWEELPISFPRVARYVAVDDTCRDRLVLEHGVPEDRVRVILNFVDLERFRQRPPLPARPVRALVFSNYIKEFQHLAAIQGACQRSGVMLDAVGMSLGNAVARPESILGQYDVVFAKGRAALEAMAVGAAVIVCDKQGVGAMVTTENFARLRRLNFGIRTMDRPLNVDRLVEEVARYDADDSAKVTAAVRAEAGLEKAVDAWMSLYQEVLATPPVTKPHDELRAAAAYLRELSPQVKDCKLKNDEIEQLQQRLDKAWSQCQAQEKTLSEALQRIAELEEQLRLTG